MDAVHANLPKPHDPFIDLVPAAGIKLTPKHYAYLKISEGCNHRCTSASSPRCAAIWSAVPSATC
jgi:ribosomal protein S12 methylthiotransferase